MRKIIAELIFILIAIISIILVVQVNQYLTPCKAEEYKIYEYGAEERKLHPYINICKSEERKLYKHSNPLWYYTLQEVKDYYKIHYNREERLECYIYQNNGKYIGSIEMGNDSVSTFEVPDSFIQSILSHLQQGLEKGWFKFIFWLDLNHGHPLLPIKVSQKIARKYADVEYVLNIIANENLGILYHAAEHFDPRDPATNEYRRTRNIIGWFDEKRLVELIHPGPDATESELRGHSVNYPKGYTTCWWMGMSAHHNGTFAIVVNNETIRLDISFYVYSTYDNVKYKHKTSHVDAEVDAVPYQPPPR